VTTLNDVAVRAGVTGATVSNVIRGRGSVGAETAERVQAAIAELGYHPNLAARALAEGRAPTLALVIANITNPFYPEFIRAAERAVRQRGHFLLVCNTDGDPAATRAYFDRVRSGISEGILATARDLPLDALQEAAARGMSSVVCMWEGLNEPGNLPSVTPDYVEIGRIAARHLLELGHRHIGMIGCGPQPPRHLLRRRGFETALAEANVALPPQRITLQPDTIQGGYDGAMELLARCPELTALFATNDLAAIGALQATHQLGLRVPEQLSIMGTTDIELAAQMRPALTTVRLHIAAVAEAAIDHLLALIRRSPDALTPPVLPEPELVQRGSTAPPLAQGRIRRGRK
jgi:DNA-binding LacI/PurR family transcriptional regulator